MDSVDYSLVVPVLKHSAMKACGGHEAGPHMLVLGIRQRLMVSFSLPVAFPVHRVITNMSCPAVPVYGNKINMLNRLLGGLLTLLSSVLV